MKRAMLLAIVAATVPMVVAASTVARAESPNACISAKMRATTKAFVCRLREKSKELNGNTADLARCDQKLTDTFATVDGKGNCTTTGNLAIALAQVAAAADSVFVDLEAAAATETEIRCVLKKAKAAQQYATCQATCLTKRLAGRIPLGHDFYNCTLALRDAFDAVEANATCPTTGEWESVLLSAGGGYGFLPDFDWGEDGAATYARLPNAWLVNNDLSNTFGYATYTGANLSGSNMSRSDFSGSEMSGANLTGVDLSYSDLTAAWLFDADLTGANLTRVRANNVNGCPLSLPAGWICPGFFMLGPTATAWSLNQPGIDLSGTDLHDILLGNANLSGANLSGANLRNANLDGANLAGADLSGADLTNARASGLVNCPAALPAGWVCVNKNLLGPSAQVYNADLAGQNLNGLDLTGAYFSGTNLSDATFAGATLTNVTWNYGSCPDHTTYTCCGSFTCCGHLIDVPATCSSPP